MKKKKIMFFLFTLSGGGAERTVVNIMNNLNKNKYDVVLVLGNRKNDAYSQLLDKKIRIIDLDLSRLRYSIFQLRKTILEVNPNLIFSTMNPNNIMIAAANALTLKKTPLILREANNRTASGNVTFFNKILTRFFYNRYATSIVSLSRGVKADLVKNFNIKEEKIQVIYNPIEVEDIVSASREPVDDFIFDEANKYIITVGRLHEQKNHDMLIRAFENIKDRLNVKLIILGEGPLEQELNSYIEKKDLQKDVFLKGFKSNPYKYVAKSDLFVLTSNWEGFGHVIVESLSLGIPVISTDCKSGPREIIGNNEYGILVPVNDSKRLEEEIEKVLTSKIDLTELKYKGKQRSKDFKALKIVKEYELLFDESMSDESD